MDFPASTWPIKTMLRWSFVPSWASTGAVSSASSSAAARRSSEDASTGSSDGVGVAVVAVVVAVVVVVLALALEEEAALAEEVGKGEESFCERGLGELFGDPCTESAV